jgi:hypothetical protein
MPVWRALKREDRERVCRNNRAKVASSYSSSSYHGVNAMTRLPCALVTVWVRAELATLLSGVWADFDALIQQ